MKQNNEQIFFHQSVDSPKPSDDDSLGSMYKFTLYLKKGDSQKYMDQFLNLSQKINSSFSTRTIQYDQSKQLNVDSSHDGSNLVNFSSSNPTFENPQLSNQSHSIFHNFQKHLTLFLRYVLHLKHIKGKSQDIKIARMLWQIFCKSKINAKKLVIIVLSEVDIKTQSKQLRHYGLYHIHMTFPNSKLNKSKQILRELITQAIQKTNLQKYLEKTRIKNKQYFICYVKQFVNQLHEGVFHRRIRRDLVIK